ncbi:hypothetical protein Ahy_B02g059109 [Arachis hypogaea]|uniref:Transposase MuDR plant domain-containing protein n=1 Tax=Arachis hypogaea TaxID=3818 RepID=A0A445AG38_ARAHY|nr:hypothetical protein Ahy_B02g059109 [Arachis hypogaea]
MTDGEFTVGMKFNSKEAIIKAMKDYTISRGVDYQVHESEPTTFYAKCTQYSAGCNWLIRVSKMSRKYYWEIRRYNGSHTCTRATIVPIAFVIVEGETSEACYFFLSNLRQHVVTRDGVGALSPIGTIPSSQLLLVVMELGLLPEYSTCFVSDTESNFLRKFKASISTEAYH